MPVTPLRLLADRALDGHLETYVQERRAAGSSWRRVAGDLLAETGLDIAPETLRLWFKNNKNEAAA